MEWAEAVKVAAASICPISNNNLNNNINNSCRVGPSEDMESTTTYSKWIQLLSVTNQDCNKWLQLIATPIKLLCWTRGTETLLWDISNRRVVIHRCFGRKHRLAISIKMKTWPLAHTKTKVQGWAMHSPPFQTVWTRDSHRNLVCNLVEYKAMRGDLHFSKRSVDFNIIKASLICSRIREWRLQHTTSSRDWVPNPTNEFDFGVGQFCIFFFLLNCIFF